MNSKIKICPSCGAKNPASFMECIECEADLTGVKLTDEGRQPQSQSAPAPVPTKMVRICSECHAENPAQARKCAECGEDISDILPTPSVTAMESLEQTSEYPYYLESVDGAFRYGICEDNMIIGRTACLSEYLETKLYVSRQHARLTRRDGKMFVENLSETNHTFVNNADIGFSHAVELHADDEIGLGGKLHNGNRQDQAAYFIFRSNE